MQRAGCGGRVFAASALVWPSIQSLGPDPLHQSGPVVQMLAERGVAVSEVELGRQALREWKQISHEVVDRVNPLRPCDRAAGVEAELDGPGAFRLHRLQREQAGGEELEAVAGDGRFQGRVQVVREELTRPGEVRGEGQEPQVLRELAQKLGVLADLRVALFMGFDALGRAVKFEVGSQDVGIRPLGDFRALGAPREDRLGGLEALSPLAELVVVLDRRVVDAGLAVADGVASA